MSAPSVEEAYLFCGAIAKRQARNFYYAFRVLPKPKRDAMCALYAFMRRADDIADDEASSVAVRRDLMAAWLGEWRRARVEGGDDPVFLALNDTQRRFGIEDGLLEDLVRGTTLDLEPNAAGVTTVSLSSAAGGTAGRQQFQVYETFEDLYGYCYLVASVVGLVSIRVFGYSDPAAEELAERTGVAFQLTNILRDVQEDAERGRIYLPVGDMDACGSGVGEVALAAGGAPAAPGLMRLLALEGARAEAYYAAAERLLPLIDEDARAALWVMVTIYHELLKKLQGRRFEVFDGRVSVSTGRKLAIFARGLWMHRRLGKSV